MDQILTSFGIAVAANRPPRLDNGVARVAVRPCGVSLIAIFLLLPFLAACESIDYGTAAPVANFSDKMLQRTLIHDGVEREYLVHLPESVQESVEQSALVMAIHGYTSTATGFREYHGLNRHANKRGYILVYPQGSHFVAATGSFIGMRITSWNDLAGNQPPSAVGPHCTESAYEYPCPPECGSCNQCAWTSCYDDVGLLEKILDAVQDEFNTDRSRNYLLGVSNGGMMAQQLACQLENRFAAVAPIISQLAPGYDCTSVDAMPMIHLFGAKDNTVRFDGRAGGDGYFYTSAEDMAKNWAASMACNMTRKPWHNQESAAAGLVCTAYTDCSLEGHEVVSCMDPTGTHQWPSQRIADAAATCVTEEQYESMPAFPHCGPTTGEYTDLGMELVWQFFSRYRLAEE